jgi:hypothetical protein
MSRFGFFLVLALSATVLSGQPGEDPAENQITIYTRFDRQPSAALLGEIRSEMDAIMAPLGLHVGWRSLDSATGREVMAEILVVSFKGTCEASEVLPDVSRRGALGWTHVSDGEVLPFSDVNCDKIRKVLETPMAGISMPERERLLGRALARVVAHEMYHFFTNTTKHASTGVARAFFSSVELACPRLKFEDAQIREVREGRLRHLLRAMRLGAAAPAGGE